MQCAGMQVGSNQPRESKAGEIGERSLRRLGATRPLRESRTAVKSQARNWEDDEGWGDANFVCGAKNSLVVAPERHLDPSCSTVTDLRSSRLRLCFCSQVSSLLEHNLNIDTIWTMHAAPTSM